MKWATPKIELLAAAVLMMALGQPTQARQVDDVDYFASFYPLNTGLIWQYDHIATESGDFWPFREVLGDSLFSNGKRYFEVKEGLSQRGGYRSRWERVDSTNLIVLRFDPSWAASIGWPLGEVPIWLLPNGDVDRSLAYSVSVSGSGDSYVHRIECDWRHREPVLEVEYLAWRCIQDPFSVNSTTVKMAQGVGVFFKQIDLEGPPAIFYKLRFTNAQGYDDGILVGTDSFTSRKVNRRGVFPNPAAAGEELHIEIHSTLRSITVQIFDLLGRQVLNETVDGTSERARLTIPNSVSGGHYVGYIEETGRRFHFVVSPR